MDTPPARILVTVTLGVAVLAGVQAPVAAQATERPEVLSVEFRGNDSFSSDSLAAALATRETSCHTAIFRYVLPFCPLGFDFAIDRHYLEPRAVREDYWRLRIYYGRRGYRDVQVDTTVTRVDDNGAGVRVRFDIDEGQPVRIGSLTFGGLDDIPDDADVLEALPVEEGDRLSAIQLEATRDTIVSRLRDSGYPHTDVLIDQFIPTGTLAAEVDFDIYAGPRARFGAIVIDRDTVGTILAERSLRRMLPFEEGDLYSKGLIYQAQRNLFGLEIVRNATIEENLSFEPDTLVPLIVRVAEGDEHRVRLGAGWSTADCVNTEATWASRNFMGGARRLQVRGRVSNILAPDLHDTACFDSGEEEFGDLNWLTSVELFQPWLFSTRNALTLSLFAERQSLPDVFVRRAVGVTGAVTRSLGSGTSMTFSYRPQLSTLDAAEIFFCTSFVVCTPDDIDVLQSANWLSPVGLSFNRNRTNDLLNPSDGYQVILDLEHASRLSGSNFAYNRVIAEGRWYEEMARRTVWAGRARFGWIAGGEFGDLSLGGLDVIHPQKRFYSGGASSVRGFPQNRLGPRVLTVNDSLLISYRPGAPGEVLPPVCTPEELTARSCDASELPDAAFLPRPQGGNRLLEATLEYRFRIGSEFQAVMFTDVGQVWGEGEPLELGEIELSPGLGVRYFSPIGPIRVDLGYRFRGAERLQVVTSQLRPYDPAIDAPSDRFTRRGPDLEPQTIDWVRFDDLALLDPRVLFGETGSFFRNVQLHFSIGQAF